VFLNIQLLAIIGLPHLMFRILSVLGVCTLTMAIPTTAIRPMSIMLGVLEQDNRYFENLKLKKDNKL